MSKGINKYYRVCKEFYGEEYTFIPNATYENLQENESGEVIRIKDEENLTKEVCFSKLIPGCFFAISMFLEDGDTYYIYETTQEPCLLAYKCSSIDFKSSQEVRYRVPVKSRYIGRFRVHSYFLCNLKDMYSDYSYGSYFDDGIILDRLKNSYRSMYNEIEYNNSMIEAEFEELKLPEEEFSYFIEEKEYFIEENKRFLHVR